MDFEVSGWSLLGVAFGVRERAVIACIFGISEFDCFGWERYFWSGDGLLVADTPLCQGRQGLGFGLLKVSRGGPLLVDSMNFLCTLFLIG